MYKILITGSTLNNNLEKKILKNIANVIVDKSWEKKNILKLISDVDGLLVDVGVDIDRDIIEHAKRLKIIVKYGVGIDNIDIESASRKGILVCNLPKVFTTEVAEFAISLVFCLMKRILLVDRDVRLNLEWDERKFTPLLLNNKNLGFIGYGNIAKKIKQLLENYQINFLATDPYIDNSIMYKENVQNKNLDNLLKMSDIVIVSTPLTKNTRNLINKKNLKYMKRNAILVNISRGGIINEDDLYKILKSKRIMGAALDVLTTEPLKKKNPLTTLNNIIITPHIAWKSEFSSKKVAIEAAEKVYKFLMGYKINGVINRSKIDYFKSHNL